MAICSPGSDIVLMAASIAIMLADGLTADETAVLAGLFSAIGDNLDLIAAKKELCEE